MLAARRLLPLFLVTSCMVDVPDPHQGVFSCKSDSDCVNGYRCSFTAGAGAGTCVSNGSGSSYDTAPPETNIDQRTPPDAQTTSQSITFTYSGTDNIGIAGFECALDSQAFQSCPGGSSGGQTSYSGLSVGPHTFKVRAKDTAGNYDGSPAVYSWQVMSATGDTAPPETTITAVNPNVSQTTSTSISISYSGTDNVGVVGFECAIDQSGFSACPGGATGGSTTYTGLTVGTHAVNVRARDAAGNVDPTPAAFSWTIVSSGGGDSTPPDTFITGQPSNPSPTGDATFYFNGTDNNQVTSLECRLDGLPFSTCANTSAGNITYNNLADGPHTFDVQAVDAAGNRDPSPAHVAWTVQRPDTVAPDTQFTGTPTSPSNVSYGNFVFTGTDNVGVTFYECSVDGGSYFTCFTGVSGSFSTSSLVDGTHTFSVRAVDAAGNRDQTPASYTWVIDTTPPTTSISSATPAFSNVRTPTITYSCNETCTFMCKLDTAAVYPCDGGSTQLPSLSEGSHTFQVWAKDSAGNQDATGKVYSWTVDVTAPTGTNGGISFTFSPSSTSTSMSASVSCYDPSGCTLTTQVDSEQSQAATGSSVLVKRWGLAEGQHTLLVNVTDGAGNQGSDSRTWQVSTQVTRVSSGPNAHHTCSILGDQSLWCTGLNDNYQVASSAPTRVGSRVYVQAGGVEPYDNWIDVTAGASHTCGIRSTGAASSEVWCWGANWAGQLGIGTGTYPNTPVRVTDPSYQWSKVRAGYEHTCAITTTNQLFCWGGNAYGQLGIGAGTPVAWANQVPGSWIDVAASYYFTCGVKTDQSVWCWGYNGQGQLGKGDTASTTTPVMISGAISYGSVAVGDAHGCAVSTGGVLYCWGASQWLQAGTGALVPTAMTSGWDGPIWSGAEHTCGLRAGNLECWGANYAGQRGNGTTQAGGPNITVGASSAGLGAAHTCAVLSGPYAGTQHCWGSREDGALGDGLIAFHPTPQLVASGTSGGTGYGRVSAGGAHTCALDQSGYAWCWGSDRRGQLGDQSSVNAQPVYDLMWQLAPTPFYTATSAWQAVDAGTSHTCAVNTAGALYCAGSNENGQLGTGASYTADSAMPKQEATLGTNWVTVAAGNAFSCGIRSTTIKILQCWGANYYAQLGRGTSTSYELTPADVGFPAGGSAYTDWIEVVAGGMHACAIRGASGVRNLHCWGDNTYGQVGVGATGTAVLIPTDVWPGTTDWRSVSAGRDHTCAIYGSTGILYCWGHGGNGQLGDGTYANRSLVASDVANLGPGWLAVSAGWYQTCGIKTVSAGKGTLWCWGGGGYGEVGLPTGGLGTPTQVGADSTWVSVSAGDFHTCAVQDSGTTRSTYCWGTNTDGQLGTGDAWDPVP